MEIKMSLKPNLKLDNYNGIFEASEITPLSELVSFICDNFMEITSVYPVGFGVSVSCSCNETVNSYTIDDKIPVEKFNALEGIISIEIHICVECGSWKLDFIG